MESIDTRIAAIRGRMKEDGLDAWIINGTDPHQSEYVCPRWRTREWATGFTGSAGTAIITHDKALLWVDSRYYIQGAEQVAGTSWLLMKQEAPGVPEPNEWLMMNVPPGGIVGISADTLMVGVHRAMEGQFSGKGIRLKATADYLNEVWGDRPAVPQTPVVELPLSISGESRSSKLARVRDFMRRQGASYFLLSSLDDIAWLLNLRGRDVEYNPVFLSYMIIGHKEAWLFTSPRRFSPDILASVSHDMHVRPYDEAPTVIADRIAVGDVVFINPEKTNMLLYQALADGVEVREGREPTTDFKAAKNETELEGMRKSHLYDGVALVNFISSLDAVKNQYNEYELTQLLAAQRLRNPGCLGDSFGPIAGFGPHGALPHYSASSVGSSPIKGNGLLVLDTGGMYEFGMTDVTRTLLFGTPTDEEKKDYTLVLKGHLALARAIFPTGTSGYQLDILARQFLWEQGLTFFHGTGHGVGHRLNVHEGPQKISSKPIAVAMVPGMVTSNEPGIYREGKHGVRIENLEAVAVHETTEFGEFLKFETLTLCPYERKLIDMTLITDKERAQIDAYHAMVYEKLHALVDDPTWLAEATKPL
ncbi:aminopeptidase P family protein [Parasphaerochaeta coccoides]|uniref:Peptidase M24 n=1 Tax=Parasphaerochaeta coccoides (strain ATCC BAA-1237 / DSM 17374 / SPN1) TaxID=760011 RepID=F4GLZ0_PARC1|nr:aminopeptidase P family protein [Parasphaerochaeta coccoides]AEC03031.1 peptidase M24 [Parasphaerochaeta coccoides DSM 17374]